jgi:cytochrome P450
VGLEPGKFDARRWLESDGSVRSPPPDVVMPFGHGMRLCPGTQALLTHVHVHAHVRPSEPWYVSRTAP